jgi:hypothetical protein
MTNVNVKVTSSQVAQWFKALHLGARGVTTDPGSIPGCMTTSCDRKSNREAHNWPNVVRARGGFGRGRLSL